MEGFYYSTLVIVLLLLMAGGIAGLLRSSSSKLARLISFLLVVIPAVILCWNPISQLFTFQPSDKDLVGRYIIVKADNDIPEENFQNHVLELKADQTFSLTPTPGIELCESGQYELDLDFVYNELAFQCDQGWTPKHIKRKINGFEIEFFLNFDTGASICFEKVE
ncbi:MAG: hypothetical protein AAFV25_12260 [Bacteroidota bacterium]